MKNLAPNLVRQRIVIEGTTDEIIKPRLIRAYLLALSRAVNMRPLRRPYAYIAEDMGYGGWIHWVTSGAHFYSYPAKCTYPLNLPLFTVDAYTCKPFSAKKAAAFTKRYLKARHIVWKEVEV